MAISDPFGTTYAGAYESFSGLGELGKGIAQARKQKQTMDLLKQFGILREESEPATIEDWQKEAKKQGAEIQLNPNLPKEEQLKTIEMFGKELGVVPQTKKKTVFDLTKAQQAGMAMNLTTGETTITPKKPEKTPMESMLEYMATQKKAKELGLEDVDISSGKGGTTIKTKSLGFGGAAIKFAEKEAPYIYNAVKRGDVSGFLNATPQTKTAVSALASQEGFDLDNAVLGYGAEKGAIANAKIQDQKVNNAISAQTLLDASYDPATGDYKVPPSQHVELALSVARMLSQTGVVPYEMVQELRQTTLREGLAGAAIYLGFDPSIIGGSTQSVINLFAKTIQREAAASEAMREAYMKGGRSTFAGRGTSTPAPLNTQSGSFRVIRVRQK